MTDTAHALEVPAGHMVMSSHMTEMASPAYPGEWAGALSRATTRKGGPGVYTPGPLRHRHISVGVIVDRWMAPRRRDVVTYVG